MRTLIIDDVSALSMFHAVVEGMMEMAEDDGTDTSIYQQLINASNVDKPSRVSVFDDVADLAATVIENTIYCEPDFKGINVDPV